MTSKRKTMSPIAFALRIFLRAYQLLLSPILGANCRYDPTCSAYAMEALEKHGALKGTWLAVRRISRCHPWGGWGYDPVPDAHDHRHAHHGTRKDGGLG